MGCDLRRRRLERGWDTTAQRGVTWYASTVKAVWKGQDAARLVKLRATPGLVYFGGGPPRSVGAAWWTLLVPTARSCEIARCVS